MRDIENKKVLHIETFPDSPLIETSCEIALNLKKKNQVFFFWSGYDLPWADWNLRLYKKILGFNYDYKINIIKKILTNNNINYLDKIKLKQKSINQVLNWSQKYNKEIKLKNYCFKNLNLGVSVESSLLSYYKSYDYRFKNKIIKKALISSALVHLRTLEAIKMVKPDVIVTFNNRFSISRPIIEAAKKFNIKVIRHEVGSSGNKYELFYDDVHNLDQRCKSIYEYWNKSKKKTRNYFAKKYFNLPYANKDIINTTGGRTKTFSKLQNKKFFPISNKRIVVFFTSSNYEFDSISTDYLKFAKSKDFKDQFSAIKSVVEIINKLPNYVLYIRVHPSSSNYSEENSHWEKYIKKKNVFLIRSESKINSFDILKKVDFVVSYGSSMAIHAAYNNIPSITLRKHPFSCSGVLLEPKNKKELYSLLQKKYLKLNVAKKCYPYGNYILTFGKKFKYFKTNEIFKGFFLNKKLNHFGFFINFVLEIIYPILKFYKKLLK